MSLVAHSPYSGTKRGLFDEESSPDQQHHHHHHPSAGLKRARFAGGGSSPSGRCLLSPSSSAQQQPLHPSTFAALCALFPQMDEQTVSSVLAECGSDIDAAIRRLTDLKLGGGGGGAAAAAAHSNGNGNGAAKDQDAALAPASSSAASVATRQQQQQQQPAAASAVAAPAASTAPAAAASEQQPRSPPAGPQTAEEWTALFVNEMAAARDMADAKQRAAKLLQLFEAFVSSRSAAAAANGHANGNGAASSGGVGAQRVEEALRENAILKRAVAIQNARLHDAVGGRDAEIARLKGALAAAEERAAALQGSNYALAVHLQMATGGAGGGVVRPPDVY